ncbi:MAG: hypothetical protein ACKVTZ_15425, partial [Bacteroidia bacterium]
MHISLSDHKERIERARKYLIDSLYYDRGKELVNELIDYLKGDLDNPPQFTPSEAYSLYRTPHLLSDVGEWDEIDEKLMLLYINSGNWKNPNNYYDFMNALIDEWAYKQIQNEGDRDHFPQVVAQLEQYGISQEETLTHIFRNYQYSYHLEKRGITEKKMTSLGKR